MTAIPGFFADRADAVGRCICGLVLVVTQLALLCLLAACARDGGYEPRNGDIVFQTSRSSQSLAIQLATKSP